MNISSFPIVMFAALLTLSGAAYSVEKEDIFSQNAVATDPIEFSQQSFNNLRSYQVMMRSSSPSDESKIIRYSFQKPGYVRMDFTQPHSGAVLIFNPVSGKVTLWPFGVGTLPILHLSPTNSLIQMSVVIGWIALISACCWAIFVICNAKGQQPQLVRKTLQDGRQCTYLWLGLEQW